MMVTGLWIIAFGLTGITVVVLFAALALFVRRIRSAPTVQNGNNEKRAIVNLIYHLNLFLT